MASLAASVHGEEAVVVALLAMAGAAITLIIVSKNRGYPVGTCILKMSKDGREFVGNAYPLRCALSNVEYKARRQQIFQPVGPNPQQASGHGRGQPGGGVGASLTRPPVLPGWLGQQVLNQPPAAISQGPQGQQG